MVHPEGRAASSPLLDRPRLRVEEGSFFVARSQWVYWLVLLAPAACVSENTRKAIASADDLSRESAKAAEASPVAARAEAPPRPVATPAPAATRAPAPPAPDSAPAVDRDTLLRRAIEGHPAIREARHRIRSRAEAARAAG